MAKNPNGVGHYFDKIINGRKRYFWRIYVKDRPIERSAYSRDDLELKVNKLKAQLQQGYNPQVRKLADFAAMYMSISTTHLKQRTRDWYASIIRLYLTNEPLGTKNIQDITPMEIESYLNSLQTKISPAYIAGIKRCLSVIYNCAIKQGLISKNPCITVKTPHINKAEIFIPSKDMVYKYLSIAKRGDYLDNQKYPFNPTQILMQQEFYTVLLLTLLTGLRRGEIYGLVWDDIDLAYHQINVRNTLVENKDGKFLTRPKTPSSIRRISLPTAAYNALIEWQALQKDYATKYYNIYCNDQNLVFPNSLGKLVNLSNINRGYWYKFRKYCDLPQNYHWHYWRHWHVSYLVSLGIKIGEITRRLGHSNPSITYSIYTHSFYNDDQLLVDSIDKNWM